MAISHGTATRTALCNTAVDRIDLAGTGQLRFLTAADAVLCTITLSATAFSEASGATATLNGVPLTGAVTSGGVVSKFRFTDGGGTVVIEGTVGTSGQDINLSSTTVAINDFIRIDALTYTAAV